MRYAERQQATEEPIWKHAVKTISPTAIPAKASRPTRAMVHAYRHRRALLLAVNKRIKPQSLCQINTRNHGNSCQVIAACLCPELPFLAARSPSAP